MSVAFLDGVYEEERFRETESHSRRYYTEEDVLNLKNRIKGWEGDIDILLTCEWPTGILNGIAKSAIDGNTLLPSVAVDCVLIRLHMLASFFTTSIHIQIVVE